MTRRLPRPDFDPRIADWLESDPNDAPDLVLETVLAAFPSIPQRRASRVRWRPTTMNRLRLIGAAAAAVVVVIAGLALVSRPTSTVGTGPTQVPSPQATASSPSVIATAGSPATGPSGSAAAAAPLVLDTRFVSARYGFALMYPAAWAVSASTKTWVAGTTNLWQSGYNDELAGPTARFSAAVQDLAAGETADAWIKAYVGGAKDPASLPSVNIGGHTGRIDFDGGAASGGTIVPGGVMYDSVVVVGRRAYNFNMDGRVDRASFEKILATVTFPAIPTFDKAFTSPLLGYSVKYPSGLAVTPAARPWTGGYSTSASMTDRYGGGIGYVATSTRIPAGMTFDQWYTGYDTSRYDTAPQFGTCEPQQLEETVVVDGVQGRLDVHCPTYYFEAVVSSGGRAYVFTAYYPISRPAFEAFLATIHLTPTSARN